MLINIEKLLLSLLSILICPIISLAAGFGTGGGGDDLTRDFSIRLHQIIDHRITKSPIKSMTTEQFKAYFKTQFQMVEVVPTETLFDLGGLPLPSPLQEARNAQAYNYSQPRDGRIGIIQLKPSYWHKALLLGKNQSGKNLDVDVAHEAFRAIGLNDQGYEYSKVFEGDPDGQLALMRLSDRVFYHETFFSGSLKLGYDSNSNQMIAFVGPISPVSNQSPSKKYHYSCESDYSFCKLVERHQNGYTYSYRIHPVSEVEISVSQKEVHSDETTRTSTSYTVVPNIEQSEKSFSTLRGHRVNRGEAVLIPFKDGYLRGNVFAIMQGTVWLFHNKTRFENAYTPLIWKVNVPQVSAQLQADCWPNTSICIGKTYRVLGDDKKILRIFSNGIAEMNGFPYFVDVNLLRD